MSQEKRLWFSLIALLLCSTLISTIHLTLAIKQEAERQRTVNQLRADYFNEVVAEIVERRDMSVELQEVVVDGYYEVAYGDGVDRIAEQQLLASEYQLQAMAGIILQNSIIIDALTLIHAMPSDDELMLLDVAKRAEEGLEELEQE